MSDNYYEILGVNKDASEDDIKRAYKKLALKTHPDKNGGDDTMFKKINIAYETLSNTDKRRQYDNPHQMPHFGGFHGEGIFEQLFNNFNMNMNVNINRQKRRGNHIYKVNISLRDAYKGISKILKVKLNKVCFDCKITCNTCNGSGMIFRIHQMGPLIQQIQNTCNNCSGSGIVNTNNTSCQLCKGNGNYIVDETINIDVPKCTPTSHKIVFNKLGEQAKTKDDEPGDLIVEVVVDEDPYFIREDNNLIFKVKLTLVETFLGKDIIVPHFDEHLNINTNMFGIINPNKRYHIKGKGLCNSSDLIFVFEVIYPEKIIDNYDRELLKNIFSNIGI